MDADLGAFARCTDDAKGCAQTLGAFTHSNQPEPFVALEDVPELKTRTVIVDLEQNLFGRGEQSHRLVLAATVFESVGE